MEYVMDNKCFVRHKLGCGHGLGTRYPNQNSHILISIYLNPIVCMKKLG